MAEEQPPEVEIDHSTRATEIVGIFRSLQNRSNKHLDEGWAEMLSVPRSSDRFYEAIGAVSRSLDLLKMEIETSSLRPPSKKTYTDAVAKLQQYVEVQNFRQLTVDNVKNEQDAFRLLTLLDDVLKPNGNRIVTADTQNEWISTLNELIQGARSAIEDATLQEFVVRQLTALQWAVQNYRFLGIETVSRTFGVMTAELTRSQGMPGAKAKSASEWYKKAKKPLIAIGLGIAATAAVVEDVDNLLDGATSVYAKLTGEDDERQGAEPPEDQAEAEKIPPQS